MTIFQIFGGGKLSDLGREASPHPPVDRTLQVLLGDSVVGAMSVVVNIVGNEGKNQTRNSEEEQRD